ncbi:POLYGLUTAMINE BINDING PROTEIN 1/MARVEL MEMBRANE-ASSOCIATING DOMAIN CONTAINING 3 [Salix koriyanagi]|uniref:POLYGLUTAMINE BINDING PROTEIN 1/MARVEL MEMBRANE-ASSOCIATING DOMAIN CONTAINING 3 n=1 Tax=Salix koriyanagi TaxID=2511006 RepID=A0A9Q0X3E8_9ROSI|nr:POLYGLUTAMINE BINDING PROTEIN 1/MARVEL MEMBRANE-ASSOCIATING DOMAIN CONTAINING 3 [Salix koriyanagi]
MSILANGIVLLHNLLLMMKNKGNQIQEPVEPESPTLLEKFNLNKAMGAMDERNRYDHDNPPLKIIRGYKLNIFYPDLINKTNSNGKTCIIRFHAGPPYEDIGFRIVNKDSDLSHKKGFKSMFGGVILWLHFNFKHHSYRR